VPATIGFVRGSKPGQVAPPQCDRSGDHLATSNCPLHLFSTLLSLPVSVADAISSGAGDVSVRNP
jgi:hypothetical protein